MQGKEAADDYLAHMTERLNQRRGERWGKFVRSTGDIPVVGELVHGAASLAFGMDQWVSGARQNLTDERLPTSSAQYASSYVGNELEEDGWKVLVAWGALLLMRPRGLCNWAVTWRRGHLLAVVLRFLC